MRFASLRAARTPQGRFLGKLARYSPVQLGELAGRSLSSPGGTIDPQTIDQVIVGNVLAAGHGMNIARQIALGLELEEQTTAFTVNMMCGSGLQSVLLARQAILSGEAEVVLCGGTESMSQAPYLLPKARAGYRLGSSELVDSLLRDGLHDAFDHQHMGETAERLAERYELTRTAQDQFALQSQQKYGAAQQANRFRDELVPVDRLPQDEHPRPDVTQEDLAALKPIFRSDGTVTAGNSSGINDGSAMAVIASRDAANRHGWPVFAILEDATVAGCDPKLMGLGPVYAIRKLLERTGTMLDRYDLIELNEAFAAQSLACMAELEIDQDDPRVNPDGGAIALGHPIGASGARLLVHAAWRIARQESTCALVALCIGGGMGIAASLRREC